MEDRLFMGTRSMGQGSGYCPQAPGSLIAGALAASIIGREAGRLNTSIEPNTARSQPHRVRGFQHSTYVSPRRRHAVRSRRCGFRDEAHPRHARRRAHTHHLRADPQPMGCGAAFFCSFFSRRRTAREAAVGRATWFTAKPIEEIRKGNPRQGTRPSSKGSRMCASCRARGR